MSFAIVSWKTNKQHNHKIYMSQLTFSFSRFYFCSIFFAETYCFYKKKVTVKYEFLKNQKFFASWICWSWILKLNICICKRLEFGLVIRNLSRIKKIHRFNEDRFQIYPYIYLKHISRTWIMVVYNYGDTERSFPSIFHAPKCQSDENNYTNSKDIAVSPF